MSIAHISAQEAAWIADTAEAKAFTDLYHAAPTSLKAQLGLKVGSVAGTNLLLATGIPDPMFNRAIGLGMRAAATLEDAQEIVESYRRASVRTWWLHWNAFAMPAGLPDRLKAAGFTEPRRKSWAKMLRGTAPPPAIATDLEITPVTEDQVPATVKAIVLAYEMPTFMTDWLRQLHKRSRWTLYGVADHGQMVGGGVVFVDGQDAWLGLGGVLPSHRRRGGQGALMARRIEDAIAMGATRIVTETGEPIANEPNPSLGNMLRCGFTHVGSRLNLVGPAR
jgi:hypothetical protein